MSNIVVKFACKDIDFAIGKIIFKFGKKGSSEYHITDFTDLDY